MTKATTKLSAQDHVILFCVATGTDHASVGILPQAMQSMALRGFIEHDRETGAYRLADSGRATLAMILDHAGSRRRGGHNREWVAHAAEAFPMFVCIWRPLCRDRSLC